MLILPLSDSIHNLGLVGHIEDIVVNKDQQGKKLGLRIIEALDYIAEKVGCYKVSLYVFCSASAAVFSPLGRSTGLGFYSMRRISVPFVVWTHLPSLLRPLSNDFSPRLFPTTFPHDSHSSLHPPHSLTQMLDKPNPFLNISKLTPFAPDNTRLFRNERRLLRQMRLQEGRTGDGTLL